MAHIMVLDDEPNICWAFRSFLDDDGHRVSIASSAEQAIARVATDPPDVLFLDVRLPGLDGLAALDQIRARCPATPVIVMTAFGTVQTAVRAVRAGAFDYLPKPFDLEQARLLIQRALHETPAPSETESEGPETATAGVLIGRSPPMQAIFKQIALAAACSEPVLITGESGTGKELVARAVHQHSDRADQPFVAVHLAALPESLVERELFGHEKGAFTGADGAGPGLLDRAGRGTIFFDEVAEAPATIQAKLLRVLDGGEYRPVGGGGERHLRARVVAATNRDLGEQVHSGTFRADLFYRLAVLPIHLPPLRQRPEDIPRLWDHFLTRIVGRSPAQLDPASPLGRCLLAHAWPGNVRELRNAAEQATRASGRGPIAPDHLPASVRSPLPAQPEPAADLPAAVARWVRLHLDRLQVEDSDLYDQFLAAVEAPLLGELLRWTGGNQARMARLLGLHRTTLRQKLRHHGFDAARSG